jgi:inhibitor of KinA
VPPFTILPAGDAALVVQLPERIDPALNAWCVSLAGRVNERLRPTVRDVVIGYCSVTVYFDPLSVDVRWLDEELRTEAERLDVDDRAVSGGIVDVPVCYGGELGPDLEDVARFAACSADEVVERHTGREYRVYLVGFVPGFAYMAEVDATIAAPRRASPRTAVPAGSVAIAGGQTGIYPATTPGGWNIIGRTPLAPYDPERSAPFLFRPGDRVRFHPIARLEAPDQWLR